MLATHLLSLSSLPSLPSLPSAASKATRSLATWLVLATLACAVTGCASQNPNDVLVTTSTATQSTAPSFTSTAAGVLQTPSNALFVTIELQVDPTKMAEFLNVMAAAAPDTRAFNGCRLFDIYVDDNTPGRVLFYEIWDSKPQQQAYLAWREETKFRDQIAPYLTGGKPANYYTKFGG